MSTLSTDLINEVKRMVVEELHLDDVEPDSIEDDALLFGGGLGLDSLDALQLAVAVEDRFAVRIADEEAGKTAFSSIKALAAYVAANR